MPPSRKVSVLVVVVARRCGIIGEPIGELNNSITSADACLGARGGDLRVVGRDDIMLVDATGLVKLLIALPNTGEPNGLSDRRRLLLGRLSKKSGPSSSLPPSRSPVMSKSSEEYRQSSFRGWADGPGFDDSGMRSIASNNVALACLATSCPKPPRVLLVRGGAFDGRGSGSGLESRLMTSGAMVMRPVGSISKERRAVGHSNDV
jgi:hypothetical protein